MAILAPKATGALWLHPASASGPNAGIMQRQVKGQEHVLKDFLARVKWVVQFVLAISDENGR